MSLKNYRRGPAERQRRRRDRHRWTNRVLSWNQQKTNIEDKDSCGFGSRGRQEGHGVEEYSVY